MQTNLLKYNLALPIEDRVSATRFKLLQLQRDIRLAIMPKLRAIRIADSRWERTLGRPLGTAKVEPIGHAVHLATMPDLAGENEPRFAAIVECAAIAQDK